MKRTTIGLVGNPNCGKTTLFNGITGAKQHIGNWPGVTVEKKEGEFTLPSGKAATLVDLPGIYSLTASSEDERASLEYLLAHEADRGLFDRLGKIPAAIRILGVIQRFVALLHGQRICRLHRMVKREALVAIVAVRRAGAVHGQTAAALLKHIGVHARDVVCPRGRQPGGCSTSKSVPSSL